MPLTITHAKVSTAVDDPLADIKASDWGSPATIGPTHVITGLDKAAVGLSNVENTALSTWAGSANLVTLGAATAESLAVPAGATGNKTFLQATLSDHGAVGSYQFVVGYAPNPGDAARGDHGLTVGYNIGRVAPTEPSFEWRIEDYYAPTASPTFLEAHWQYYDPAGGSYRPIALQIDRSVGGYLTDSSMSLVSTALSFSVPGVGQFLKAVSGTLQLMSGMNVTQFTPGTTNFQWLKQMNGANTRANSLIYTDASDRVVLGDFNGTSDVLIYSVGSTPKLLFGGVTASFPALKRTAAVLETKLADDSAYAGHTALTFTVTQAAVGNTLVDGFVSQNTTAATAGVPIQVAPSIRLRSHVWNSTGVVDNTDDWYVLSVPVNGATPSGMLKFGKSLNGGAVTYPLTVDSAGNLTTLASVNAVNVLSSGDLRAAGANSIYWNGQTIFKSPLNGQLNITNFASSAGIGFDVATDAVLKVRTRAQSGDASISALLLQVMTAIVAAGGGAAPTFTTIGGSGPATAAQNGWLKFTDSGGAACYVPVWK